MAIRKYENEQNEADNWLSRLVHRLRRPLFKKYSFAWTFFVLLFASPFIIFAIVFLKIWITVVMSM